MHATINVQSTKQQKLACKRRNAHQVNELSEERGIKTLGTIYETIRNKNKNKRKSKKMENKQKRNKGSR